MNADPHHGRLHSQWSASATSRNVVCAGAIAMESLCEDRESEAAAWGTCAHQIAERCLRSREGESVAAITFLGDTEKSGAFEFVIDEEMANCAQIYVDYVLEASVFGVAKDLWIEQRFTLDGIDPPFQAGGTADAVIYDRGGSLEVVDLKGGRGVVVEAKNNPQMRTYALGALLAFPDINVHTITATIVQPRADHKDGRIRSETFHVADLIDWTHDLLKSMRRAKQALDEFEGLGGDRAAFEAWAEKWLATGQCTFCSAKAICPKIKAEALALAGRQAAQWFETVEETPITLPDPKLLTPAELARLLDGFDMLTGWVSAVRAYAHGLAERGVEIPTYQLAEKIGNRSWLESDQAKLAEELGAALQIEPEALHEPSKVKSVAQIEKTLGSKRKSELAALEGVLWGRPVKGTNLVASSRTTRPPALSKPETFFEKLP